MKKFALLFSLLIVIVNGACTTTSPSTNVAVLDHIDFSDIEIMKKGKSCSYYFLGLIGPIGDTNLRESTKEARIRKVKYVEKTHGGFPMLTLPLVYKTCIVAYGD